MKVNFNTYSQQVYYCNNLPVFRGIKLKKQTLYDLFVRTPVGYQNPKESLKKIQEVQPQCLGGTKCKGSIPLRCFWDFFEKTQYVKNSGYSTNTAGYGNSFLKAKADKPLSTSFVHDCSVMYLYDKNSGTHALYHALPDCTKETLQFMIKTLMPEGFTMGAIIPGDSLFYREQEWNMKNMLKLLKRTASNAVVNVFHSMFKYPEIVGVRGGVYEIPNRKVQKQINEGIFDADDFGQATFRIVDLQGYNTFENIKYNCKTLDDLKNLKKCFRKANYPKEILKILLDEIEKKKAELSK